MKKMIKIKFLRLL
jgi:hypothetical protein